MKIEKIRALYLKTDFRIAGVRAPFYAYFFVQSNLKYIFNTSSSCLRVEAVIKNPRNNLKEKTAKQL